MSNKAEQRLASQMMRVYASGNLPRQEGEPDKEYFGRVRKLATHAQHEQRAMKRKAARAARKKNR